MALDAAGVAALQNSTPTNWAQHDFELSQRSSGDANRFADDKKLHVRFYRAPMLDNEASVEANRAIYKDAEMVEIMMPGEKNNIIRDLVWKQHIDRFPEQYAKFKAGQAQHNGTLLSVLPFLSESNVKELEFFNVFTVEQLAGMSDSATQRFMGAVELKRKAKEWLEQMNSGAQLRKEIAAKEAEADEKLAAVQAENAALKERLAAIEARFSKK